MPGCTHTQEPLSSTDYSMGLKEENWQLSAEGSKGGSRSWGCKYELIKMHYMNSYRINKIEEKGIFQESYYVMP